MTSPADITQITAPGRMVRFRAIALIGLMVLSACTYTKDDDVVLPERFEQPGVLAFADDGLAADQWVVANTDDGLNLRAEPNIGSEKLARLAAGETLDSTGHVSDIDGVRWIEVRWESTVGWVHSGYLAPIGDPDEAFATSELEGNDDQGDSESSDDLAAGEADDPDTTVTDISAGRTLVVTGVSTGLNLLSEPGGAEIIETLDALTEVTETGESQDPWVQVAHGDTVGWAHGEFLIPLNDGDLTAATDGEDSGTTGAAYIYVEETAGLNLRAAPNGVIIDRLISGTIVVRTGIVSGQWAEITHDNRTGWVSSRFLIEIVGDLADRGASVAESVKVTNTPGSVGVNIRDVPNGEILTGMPDGQWGVLTGNRTELWAELEYDGVVGWAFIDLLLPVEGIEEVVDQ